MDPDKVEERNLRTQVYDPEDIGKYKAVALAEKLKPYSKVNFYIKRIEEIIDELPNYDLALALTDNIESRLVVERRYKTLHAMVQPTHGILMMTTRRSRLANIMKSGRYRGNQELSMIMMVVSIVINETLKYLKYKKSNIEGKLMIVSPYKFEIIELEGL